MEVMGHDVTLSANLLRGVCYTARPRSFQFVLQHFGVRVLVDDERFVPEPE